MDFFALLRPIEIAVSYVLVGFYNALTFLGMDGSSGWTWALSIVGLVITIRVALIPLFVRQINASRAMQLIAPDLRKIQEKYKGKKDQASREALSRETMELYREHKTNPFSSCLPILVQAPIFFALFRVLNTHIREDSGIGALTTELAHSAATSSILGAGLVESFNDASTWNVRWVAIVLIVAMVATTFWTQRQLTRKNMPASALEGPMAQQQKIMMYALPFIFVFSGPWFPIGVLIYWTTTNLWTMGQQFYVIKANPTPGSEAARALEEKRKAKAIERAEKRREEIPEEYQVEEKPAGQREQPKRKKRKK